MAWTQQIKGSSLGYISLTYSAMSLSIYVSIYNAGLQQETFLRSIYKAVAELILEFKCRGIRRDESLWLPIPQNEKKVTRTPEILSICKLKACLSDLQRRCWTPLLRNAWRACILTRDGVRLGRALWRSGIQGIYPPSNLCRHNWRLRSRPETHTA